jgi:hypothetical protein
MGKREIEQTTTVTKTKSVAVCDFCGRDDETTDTHHKDVRVNHAISAQSTSKNRASTKENGDIVVSGVISKDGVNTFWRSHQDSEYHLCGQCRDAFMEGLDDTS